MDRADAAAHVFRGRELHDSRTHEDAHRIRRAHHAERDERHRKVARQREHDRADAEYRDAAEERAAGVRLALLGELGEHQAGGDGADGEHAAQHAEAGGPDVQDVAREDRQQRIDAAEQHGEEIERDGAEHDRLGHQVAQARHRA